MKKALHSRRPEVSIFSSVLAGQYVEGFSTFQTLPSPTVLDMRWAGVCAFNLQDIVLAETLTRAASVGGCNAAAIELATIYRQRGDYPLAEQVLLSCDLAGYSPFDQALWYREKGSHDFSLGRLIEAADALQSAWTIAHSTAELLQLLPSIGQALALLHSMQGRDRRAQTIVDQVLPKANQARAVYLRSARGLAKTYLGLFVEAEQDLKQALADCADIPVARPIVTYNTAVLARARGQFGEAADAFNRVVHLAGEACEPETECYAHLGLVAVSLTLGEIGGAQAHLARAQQLVVSERVRGMVLLRRATLLLALERPEGAAAVLAEALNIFTALGLQRELGWCRLYLADLALRSEKSDAAFAHLEEAVNIRHALNSPFLTYELRTMPRVRTFLDTLPSEHYCAILSRDIQSLSGDPSPKVFIHTFGQASIFVNGTRARLDLARSVEVLMFLMLHPPATSESILSQVFPDESPKKARNYFHQARYELARAVPGLQIKFDESRFYSADWNGVQVTADVFELRQGMSKPMYEQLEIALDRYSAPFLPRSETEWVAEVRLKLVSDLIYFGRRVLGEVRSESGEARYLVLAERVIELNPLDAGLVEDIVKCTWQQFGHKTARFLLERAIERFTASFCKCPDALLHLHEELRKVI